MKPALPLLGRRLAAAVPAAFVLAAACAAACGGGGRGAGGPVRGPDLGAGGATEPTTPPAPPAVDPHLEARRAYANPGGMWMPQQMTLPGHAAAFAELGVELDPKVLADPLAAPLGAIVRLRGCSASFVSPDGLIVTNHHCVQRALQVNSTPERNLVERGFLARTRAEEPSAGPAERVYVAQAFTDVTATVTDGLAALADPVARKEEVERRIKRQIATCEQDRPGIRCNVATYLRGGLYMLIEELELRDVRLVYVPARSIGNYGGEIDNWRWPRHTGDFAFYRAYVGQDGAPADHAADNVPYRPRHHLKVSARGTRPNDFVMIAGFPGRTTRTRTAAEVQHDVEWYYPYFIEHAKQQYAIVEGLLSAPGATAIKAGVLKQGVQNRLEKIGGVLKGLTAGDLLDRKAALDARVAEWAAAPGRERHREALARLAELTRDEQRTARADYDRDAAFRDSQLLATALQLTRWAEERGRPDADRKAGYQDRDRAPAIASHKQLTRQFDATLDRALFRLALVRALALPPAERPWLPLLLGVKPTARIDEALIDRTLDTWYRTSKLADEALRLELLERATPKTLTASRDPFLRAAGRVWKLSGDAERRADARAGALMLVAPVYADALREVQGGLLAPDANSTLRITYGTVRAFRPGDPPYTTAAQLLDKDTGEEPFDAPAALLAAVRARQFGPYADASGELPVNFLSDLDTTGGNSGSAVLDARGQLVGLNFDSTIEGVAADVVFDGTIVRKIHVDVRYMLWVMDKLDDADHLLVELGVTPRL
ncbi:MAG: S46 family peptidase [Kofleriaceae bacterium]|nr:S46 family peptidase [Kofleriaceae bacterium]MCL4223156.1 S46 family peptidase [Myxococcales bacterium]